MTCAHPECDKEVWPYSGLHQFCYPCYAKWHNGYAEAYGWVKMDPDVEPEMEVEFDG